MRVPSRFWRTFSVTLMLRRRSVEKPEEDSVSVGELGQETASRRPAAAASMPGSELGHTRLRASSSCTQRETTFRSGIQKINN